MRDNGVHSRPVPPENARHGGAPRPAAASDASWIVTGVLLTSLYTAQAALGWRLDWVARLQDIELYKQVTGLALATLFITQWRLSLVRTVGGDHEPAALLATHRIHGALAPILLYLHAIGLGHAYVRVMSCLFLAVLGLGLVQSPLTRLRSRRAGTVWLVTHVALAASLVFLIGYHAFNAFYYE